MNLSDSLMKRELGRHPDHDLLGEAGEVHGRDRRGGERLQREVAVRHRVERVGGRTVEAQRLGGRMPVDREGGAGERGGPQRTLVEPRARIGKATTVAGEHLDVGEEVMTEGHGLRRLQVREARHDEIVARLGLARERQLQAGERGIGLVDPVAHVEPEVGRHLVVARAGGVQAAGRLADQLLEAALDVHVHVLERAREHELAGLDLLQHPVEAGPDLAGVVPGDDALGREHGRVRLGGADILGRQRLVEADGGVYLLHDLGGRHGEAATPHLVGGLVGHDAALARGCCCARRMTRC